ncbi:MAG: hypothetical protein SPH79_06205 [Schaalia hyovaginalis]|uniref:Uncharacterized protein n=1 Tax=Schaalia hyovaginalis TaxID=29316 RepID=A0A923E692_9ACTO|nr:hypothetical protein [Schaalia hyovaginalis]MBB6335127.1 hypothetical protein [Schaalia hyovaginalis]MDY6214065.1 hypothetical protein [Schaalia hyovaginalis]
MGDLAILATITPTTWALIAAGWIIPGLWSHFRHHEPWRTALTLVPLRLWAHIAWSIITVLIDAAFTILRIIVGLIAGAFLLTAFTDTGRGH